LLSGVGGIIVIFICQLSCAWASIFFSISEWIYQLERRVEDQEKIIEEQQQQIQKLEQESEHLDQLAVNQRVQIGVLKGDLETD
jgi:cell division protein FtsL